MMCRGSKAIFFGGVLAGAGASRSHAGMKSASAVQAVDTIASMLNLQHEEVRRIAEAADAQATPGSEDKYTGSLKKVLDNIKVTLKPKVSDAQESMQNKIDDAVNAVEEAERGAVAAKEKADKEDKAWFACVTSELELKEFQETAQKKLEEAKEDEEEARALEQKSTGFAYDAGERYEKSFQCSHEVEGGCEQSMQGMKKSLGQMLAEAEAELKAADNYYSDMAAQLAEREKETLEAEEALETAGGDHEQHRNRCQAAKLRRDRSICEYGYVLQAKGVQTEEYTAVIASIEGQGETSEADRLQEWKTLSHTECMLERGIEKGLSGPIDAKDHQECSEQSALDSLDRKADTMAELRKSHPTDAAQIIFSNGGEAWKVASNGQSATDYSKEDFKPTLNPDASQQPFGMCPQESMANWKAVVVDRLVAGSTTPGAWAKMSKMWAQ